MTADCLDCRAAAAHAYSDATTPGFFRDHCTKHSDVCAFCGAVGVMNKCTWKVEKEVSIPIRDLRVGDRFRVMPMRFQQVLSVIWSQNGETVYFQLAGYSSPWTATAGRGEFAGTFRGIRLAPCAAACCDLCSVERNASVHYCRDHWELPS